MDRTIIIVGAGFGQLPAIKKAKDIGLKVVAVDKNPDAPGMAMADYAYAIDVLDQAGVLSVAKKHRIAGIMTMQSDLPVPTIGYVNDALNLKGVSFEVANFCSNKIETRKRLKLKGCSQPNFEIVHTTADALHAAEKIGYPCVIKAPDSSGSRGISKAKVADDVEPAFLEALKYSRGTAIIVEEYIDGLEFGAQTFSINGVCELVILHGDTVSNPPYMIPIGHSFPFDELNDNEILQAEQNIKEAIQALGIHDGPANVDLILDKKTKEVKVIEVGARIGATCLPELVEYYSGIDWVKAAILSAVGDEVKLAFKYRRPVAAEIIEAPLDGDYKGYQITDQALSKQAIEIEVTAKVGEKINKLRKGTDRIGKVIVYGETAQKAEALARTIKEHILIEVNA